jgi:hypothetical protein
MRFLIGIILGAALTVGAAWVIDTRNIGNLDGPVVNWNQVDKGWKQMRDGARVQISRLPN